MPHTIHPWAAISNQYHKGTIVLGNGSSIAVSDSFAYGSLLEHARHTGTLAADVQTLFKFFNTEDFELILRLVWQASNVNQSLQIPDQRTHQAYINVRDCLITAVRSIHPPYADISHHLAQTYQFLKRFDTVISLNYDLLVYWTMTYGLNIKDGHKFKDCFLRRSSNNEYGTFDDDWQRFRTLYTEKTNTLVFYPHGNLALCRDRVEQEYKLYHIGTGQDLLEEILQAWQSGNVIPLFVSEGTAEQKISSIQNSYYLSTVYRDVLTSEQSTLTLLGWGVGEHDRHLLKRMRGTGIRQVAVAVYGDDQAFCNRVHQIIQDDLGQVNVDFFDCESPSCWIHP